MMSALTSFLAMMSGEAVAQAGEAAAQAAPGAAGQAAAAGDAAQAAASAAEAQWSTGGTFWLPDTASATTQSTDMIFYGVLGLSIFCFVGITAAVLYFVIKYRARPGHEPEPSAHHNDALEITWTIIPSIICVFLFVFGWRGYINLATPPKHSLEIQVTAQKWSWNFSHPNGVNDAALHVPVDRSVRMIMKSQDVIHSFFVPAFRVKKDVLPRRYTEVWFKAAEPGVYRLYCAEYCGRDHSLMKTKVVVHEPGGYERYLAEKEAELQNIPPVELGKKVYDVRCVACHTTDGTPRVGPTFKGVWGTESAFTDGTKAAVDENYVRDSILDPQSQIRQGYPPTMPSFKGQLSDKEITGVIEYIKSLQ